MGYQRVFCHHQLLGMFPNVSLLTKQSTSCYIIRVMKKVFFSIKNCVKVIRCIFRLRNLHVWNSRVWLSQPFSSIRSVSFQSSIVYWQIFQYCQNLSFFKEHLSSIIKLFILLGPSLLMLKPVDLKCIELSLFGHCRSINDLILIVQISLK